MRLWKDRQLELSITRLGLQFLAALLALGVLALNTGNNLLHLVFCLLLGFFLVSGWVSMRALQHLHLEDVEEGQLFARVKGALRLRFRDGAPGRVRALVLRLELEGGTTEPAFHAGGERQPEPRVAVPIRPARRGPFRVLAVVIGTRHPFGLLEKRRRFPLDHGLLAAPRPLSRLPGTGRHEGTRLQGSRPGSGAPEGARPFRTGDPLARVHWKRTAQRGQPWVRTLEEEQPAGLQLELDLGAWMPGAVFEEHLERLSGAVFQARLLRRPVRLELRGAAGRRTFEEPSACWRALALASAEGTSDPVVFSEAGAQPWPSSALD